MRILPVTAAALLVATSAVAQPTLSPERSIHEMAARDDVPGIARAIQAGVPPNVRDREGRTALHVAVEEVHLFAVMMLLAKGADPRARDRSGRTPLHLAADGDRRREGERFQIVKVLLAKGADRNAVDDEGNRPVDLAKIVEFRSALEP
jgi:ankyrin repeat protein